MIILLSVLSAHAQTRFISLEECLESGKDASNSVKNSKLDVLAAEAQLKEARWEYAPRVSINSYGFYAIDPLIKINVKDVIGNSDAANEINNTINAFAQENGIKNVFTTLKKGYGASAVVLQPIYAGGRIANGNKLAGIGVKAASLNLRLKEKESASGTEERYWRAVGLQEKQITLMHAMRLLDTLYRDASYAWEAGLIVESDVKEVEQKRNELKASELKLRKGLRLAKMDLLNKAGLEYSVLGLDSLILNGKSEDVMEPHTYMIPEGSASESEESQLLSLQIQAKELEKKMAVGELLPQINAGASYGYNDGHPGSKTNGLGFISVSIPITDLGKAAQRSRRYSYNIQKARNEKESIEADLLLRRRMREVEMESAWDQIQLDSMILENARTKAIRSEADFKAGRSGVSQWLTAETEKRQAEEALLESRIAYRLAVRAYLDVR